MSSSEKNTALPISTAPDEPSTEDQPVTKKAGRRRRCLLCLTCSAAVLAVIGIVVVVLSFTVYKVREPTMRVNSFHFGQLDPTKNLTVVADVSVMNPNPVSFKFNSSTTSLL